MLFKKLKKKFKPYYLIDNTTTGETLKFETMTEVNQYVDNLILKEQRDYAIRFARKYLDTTEANLIIDILNGHLNREDLDNYEKSRKKKPGRPKKVNK